MATIPQAMDPNPSRGRTDDAPGGLGTASMRLVQRPRLVQEQSDVGDKFRFPGKSQVWIPRPPS